MHSLQALRENRAAKAKEARNLLDPATTVYTKEIEAKVDAIYAEIDVLDNQIQRIEKSIVMTGALESSAADLHDRDNISKDEAEAKIRTAKKAFAKALRFGDAGLTPEEYSLVSANSTANRRRVQNVALSPTSAGGFMVPTEIFPQLLIKLKYFGGVRTVAKIMGTTGGNPIQWATMDDTGQTGELVAEAVVASTSDLTFGSVTINAYKFSSKIIPVSMEILQDSAIDVESLVMDAITIRIARAENTFFTTGTGTAQPQGVVTGAFLGVTLPVGNTITLTYDGLIDLFHSLDPAYRDSSSVAWMMNDTTFKIIKKLKDTQNRPLWLPTTGSAFELPNGSLEGKPIVINQDMASPAANAKTILFGDFSKYLIRDVMDTMILRFADSPYTSKGQIAFLAWARSDGRIIDATAESIRHLAQSAT